MNIDDAWIIHTWIISESWNCMNLLQHVGSTVGVCRSKQGFWARDHWVGGMLTFIATARFSCTSAHTSCYATLGGWGGCSRSLRLLCSLVLPHIRPATLLLGSLALPHIRHATLGSMKNGNLPRKLPLMRHAINSTKHSNNSSKLNMAPKEV